jgi:hypothetical protein
MHESNFFSIDAPEGWRITEKETVDNVDSVTFKSPDNGVSMLIFAWKKADDLTHDDAIAGIVQGIAGRIDQVEREAQTDWCGRSIISGHTTKGTLKQSGIPFVYEIYALEEKGVCFVINVVGLAEDVEAYNLALKQFSESLVAK